MKQSEVQSIYGKGFEDGFNKAIDKMRKDGWKVAESPEGLETNQRAKNLYESWTGILKGGEKGYIKRIDKYGCLIRLDDGGRVFRNFGEFAVKVKCK